MRYSDDLVEQVRSANDIVEVIGEAVALKRSGSNYTGLCPFHNEKTASFSVSRQKQMYYCFGCHAGGNVVTFLMQYYHMTFMEAMQSLAARAHITLPEEEISQEARAKAARKSTMLAIYKRAAGYYYYLLRNRAGERGKSYLLDRGITEETMQKWGLGYSGRGGGQLYKYLKEKGFSDELLSESGLFTIDEKRGAMDKFWNRVMFPILDIQGRVIAFGGRVMGDAKPKYLNSPETELFNKRRELFGLHFARSSKRPYIILCEGYMDVITMHQAGFDCAVASLGTALTSQQASLLKRYTGEVLLLYDSDAAGVNAALRAVPILRDAGLAARIVSVAPAKDPDEFIKTYGAEAFEERLTGSQNAFLFETAQRARQYNLSDPQDMTFFQREVARSLLTFTEDLERNNYIEAVSRQYRIPADGLRKLVNTMAMTSPPPEREREAVPFKKDRKPVRDTGYVTAQKLMLTYLADMPEVYQETKTYLTPEDFTDPVCRKLADGLYRQLAEGRVSEAALVNLFTDAEEQAAAAAVFRTTVPAASQAEQERALTDTVVRILRESNAARMKSLDQTDRKALADLIEQKKMIEAFASGKRVIHLPERPIDT